MKIGKMSKEDPEKYGSKTGRDDQIEIARWIWEWSRARKDDVEIQHNVLTGRLVLLVQVSSASVEGAFSQVKIICETCGVVPLEETLETCLIKQVNKYYEEGAQKEME